MDEDEQNSEQDDEKQEDYGSSFCFQFPTNGSSRLFLGHSKSQTILTEHPFREVE
jgi:hypothetical protein